MSYSTRASARNGACNISSNGLGGLHASSEFCTTISTLYDINVLRKLRGNDSAMLEFIGKFGGVPHKPITEVPMALHLANISLHQIEVGGIITLQSKSNGRRDPRHFRSTTDLVRTNTAVQKDYPKGYRPFKTVEAKQIIKDLQRAVDSACTAVSCSEKYLPHVHLMNWKEQNTANNDPRLISYHCDQKTSVDPHGLTSRMLPCFGPAFKLLLRLIAVYNDGIPYTKIDKHGVEHSYDGTDHQQPIFTVTIPIPANHVYLLSHYLAGRSAVGFAKVQDEQGKEHNARLVFQHMTKMENNRTKEPRCIVVVDCVHEDLALSNAFVTQFASGTLPRGFHRPLADLFNQLKGPRRIAGLEVYSNNWLTTVPNTLKTMEPYERHNIVLCGCTGCLEQASSFILSEPCDDDRGGRETLRSIEAGEGYELEDIEPYLHCADHAQRYDENDRVDDLCVTCYTRQSVNCYDTCEECRPHYCNGVQGNDESSERLYVCDEVDEGSDRGVLLTNENSGATKGVCLACLRERFRRKRERDNMENGKATRTLDLVSHDVFRQRIEVILRLRAKHRGTRMVKGKPIITWSTLVQDEEFTRSEVCEGMDTAKCQAVWAGFHRSHPNIETVADFRAAIKDGLTLGHHALSDGKRKKAKKEAKKKKADMKSDEDESEKGEGLSVEQQWVGCDM